MNKNTKKILIVAVLVALVYLLHKRSIKQIEYIITPYGRELRDRESGPTGDQARSGIVALPRIDGIPYEGKDDYGYYVWSMYGNVRHKEYVYVRKVSY